MNQPEMKKKSIHMKLRIFNTQLFVNPRHTLSCAALFAALLLIRFARWVMSPYLRAPAPGKLSAPDLLSSVAASAATQLSSPVDRVRLDIAFFEEPETEIMIGDRLAGRHQVRNSFVASACACFLAFCVAFAPTQKSSAAVLTWTGASFYSANWSDSANWDAAAAPNNGDTLIFPSNGQQTINTNDLVGLTLNQLQFVGNGSSFEINGNALTLTNGIQVNYSFGAIYIYNNISLAGTDNVIDVEKPNNQVGYLYLLGTLSGNVGVIKTGAGALVYQAPGNNSYTGTTHVNDGWLELNVGGPHAFSGPLVVGDGAGTNAPLVALLQSVEISGAPVTVNLNGTLDLNGYNDLLNTLTLQGGTVQSGPGTLSIYSEVTVLPASVPATIFGNLRLNGAPNVVNVAHTNAISDLNLAANLSDGGGGVLFTNSAPSQAFVRLYGTNTFTGPITLDNLKLSAETPSALGATNSLTTAGSHGTLLLVSTGITNHSLTLAGGATLVGQGNCCWAGPITLNGSATMDGFPAAATLELAGPISGPGGFSKVDNGSLLLSGTTPNTYSGTTTVLRGTLELNKSGAIAVPGSLVLTNGATARLMQSWQLYSPYRSPSLTVTLYPNSLFDLAGFEEWIGPLITKGGKITTGDSGLLFQTGDITVITNNIAASSISGNLQLYGYAAVTNTTIFCAGHFLFPDLTISANLSSANLGSLIANGNGQIELAGAGNTFAAAVTINGGSLWLDYSNGLGNTNTAATVNTGGSLVLQNNAAVGLKPLVLNGNGSAVSALTAYGGADSWAGDITLASDSTVSAISNVVTSANLTLSGTIGGPGGLTKSGQGIVVLSGSTSNNFAGTTFVQQGMLELTKTNAVAIPGPVAIGGGLDGPNGDVLRTLQPNQFGQSNTVNITSSGLFDITLGSITRVGSITGSGSVQLGSSMLMMGYDNASTSFGGTISGYGDLTKVGSGTFTYGGTGSYSGNFGINSGQVFVDGSLASAAIFSYAGTTLGGSGSVGPITSFTGLLTPGDNNPGILNSGSMSLGSSATLLAYITGTNAGSGYSQLNFSGGTISLGNAHLQLNMSTLGATNAHYTLIHNPTLHVISGTFSGLAEGATVTANNGVHFTITYHGGPTGNDVVLAQTSLPTPPNLTGITQLTNGIITITGTGAPNVTYHVQANTNLTTTNWINLAPVTANNLGALVFTDSQANLYPERFYRFVYP
jgi:autotransporter-associated beta strand protein